MIHRLNSLSVTEKLYENMQPSGNDMRFAAIESDLAVYPQKCSTWHWHEYVEFGYVAEGMTDCCTPRQSLTLKEGDGYFVNASVLHMNRMTAGSEAAKLRILQFDASMLSCAGVIARRFIQPVERATGLECFWFSRDHAEHRDVLDDMRALFDTAAQENKGYEMRILELLFSLWQKLYIQAEDSLEEASPMLNDRSARIKEMLSFIHESYGEDISVADIGSHAHISEREAFRTFRQVLGMTPGAYLQRYRVNRASRLLTETDGSVTDIALKCGFSSPNYFCMAFKEAAGMSPRDFRKANGGGKAL